MDSDVYIQGLRSCIHSEYGGGGLEFVSGLPDRSRLPEACRVSQPEGRGVEDEGDEGEEKKEEAVEGLVQERLEWLRKAAAGVS